ncbi:nuclear transport factor 2 family protein [Pseudomonas sp. SbB1]|nr:nuclear transport factor 2 family protein [Pseudomonas sp. T34]NOG88159.1 nuclear transport factor 2 family protein [Pseudomonas sp. SbB1]HDS1711969.1 nuclear transport factor 2 family protein [Pseudomonas putida]HDS1750021.1 nuclear transport factor 2 family protein [Pseudomonas putida]
MERAGSGRNGPEEDTVKISSNLSLMRKEWCNAFYTLNIEQLDYLEADWFFSTNGIKFMYKKNQLHKLSVLRGQDASAFSQHKRTESNVEVRELGNLAAVSGVAFIVTPQGSKQINFVESWIKINDSWKLQFQSFEGEG